MTLRTLSIVLTLGLSTAPAASQETANGTGAMVRALDRAAGESEDFSLAAGETVGFGRISINVTQCRYPVDNPEGNAFAWVTVWDTDSAVVHFDGWMVAASPALNAMDHPRYDVWVLRCNRS
ncbi:DUF2155 domain-containing protein [Roseicitreum antarcticum]|uniref:DUF2155 domain-containing protein n=1 Tax=Roseicitreum antarcticum TaxID=564137 RepID=A0A1H3C6D7_9RHOB|nr:DUF2155 domain-containing protein [Roseicitreum antarcticum]SDX49458.1 hypothetical protein SAMN04488238_10932 [Roseicitreum antarcticum]